MTLNGRVLGEPDGAIGVAAVSCVQRALAVSARKAQALQPLQRQRCKKRDTCFLLTFYVYCDTCSTV